MEIILNGNYMALVPTHCNCDGDNCSDCSSFCGEEGGTCYTD